MLMNHADAALYQALVQIALWSGNAKVIAAVREAVQSRQDAGEGGGKPAPEAASRQGFEPFEYTERN